MYYVTRSKSFVMFSVISAFSASFDVTWQQAWDIGTHLCRPPHPRPTTSLRDHINMTSANFFAFLTPSPSPQLFLYYIIHATSLTLSALWGVDPSATPTTDIVQVWSLTRDFQHGPMRRRSQSLLTPRGERWEGTKKCKPGLTSRVRAGT